MELESTEITAQVYEALKNDFDPLKKVIDFFMEQIFPKM